METIKDNWYWWVSLLLLVLTGWRIYQKNHPKTATPKPTSKTKGEHTLHIGEIFTWIVFIGALAWVTFEGIKYWETDKSKPPLFLLPLILVPLVHWIATGKDKGATQWFYWIFGAILALGGFVYKGKARLAEREAQVAQWASSPTHSSAMMEEFQIRKGNTEVRHWKGEFKPLKASSWKPCEAKLDWGFNSLTFELLSMKNSEFFTVTVRNVPGSLTAEGTWTWHSSDRLRRLDGKVTLNVPLPNSADKYAPVSGTLHQLPHKGMGGEKKDLPFLLTPSDREDYLRRVLR